MTEAEFEAEKERITTKKQELAVSNTIQGNLAKFCQNSISNRAGEMQAFADKVVDAEFEVAETKLQGKKEVEKAKTEKDVTKARTEVDTEKTERNKTILKAQGLTEKLPPAFRVTALIVGYPFFLLYLLTLGWVIQFITFVVKGFITMVFDCADRYVELNNKFTENEKEFKLGKAIFNILKWALIITGVVLLIIFLRK